MWETSAGQCKKTKDVYKTLHSHHLQRITLATETPAWN